MWPAHPHPVLDREPGEPVGLGEVVAVGGRVDHVPLRLVLEHEQVDVAGEQLREPGVVEVLRLRRGAEPEPGTARIVTQGVRAPPARSASDPKPKGVRPL